LQLAEPRELRRAAATGYSPSDEDRAALAVLDKHFRPDDPIRLRLEAQWDINRAFLVGLQYLTTDPNTRQLGYSQAPTLRWRARSVHNLIRPYLRQAVSTVGNFRPRFKVRPGSNDPEDLQAANVAEKVLSHYWDLLRMPAKKWELLHWLKTCGNVFLKVQWDPNGGDPLHDERMVETADGPMSVVDLMYEGEMVSEIVSPYHVYLDNYAESTEDLVRIMIGRARPIEWVEQHFPEIAPFVPVGMQPKTSGNQGRWLMQSAALFGGSDQDAEHWKDWVFVREMYEEPTQDYPRGRLVIDANNVICLNGDNPTPRHKLPIVWLRDELVPGQVWAESDVNNQITLQRSYNRLQSKELEHVVLTANAKILEHATNELPNSALVTEIGERVKWNGMHPPEWLAPPQLPNDLEALKGSILQDFDRVASTFGAERGQYQGKISGKAYISLIEQGIQNKAPTVERLADSLSEWGRLLLEWVQDNVIEDRLVKIVGRGQQFDVIEFKGADLRGNTDVTIDVDSMMPKSKALALELLTVLAPGQPWLNAGDSDDRARVFRMLALEDENKIVEDKMVDLSEATIENSKLMLGEMVEPAQAYQDQEVHVFVINQLRKSDEYKKADPIIRALVDAHAQSHYDISMPVAGVTVQQEETAMEGPEQKPRGGGGGGERQAPPRQSRQQLQPFT
jgi:hypothetical protein